MEQDDESDHQESDTAEHAPVTPSERESGLHKISLQIDPLMCSYSELPPNRTKGSAQRLVKQQTMEYLKTCMQEMTQAPPMAIFRRAEHYSVTMELPLEAAKRVLFGSSKLQGIEARPWMPKGSPGPGLEARILWLKAPNMKSSSNIWEILHSQYWFAGVLTGDTVGRWGIRIWGTEEPSEQQRTGIANLLGAEAPTTRTRLRVYGYPAGFGYGTTWAQEEAARVFPSGRVQVRSCQHLVNTSITKPVFDITVTGVPTEMAGAQAGVHRHASKPKNLEAVRVAQTPTSSGKSWTPREAMSSHTGGQRPRDYLFARRHGGQPRHGVRTIMLTVWTVALLRPMTCTSRYKQPPCYASRTRPPRWKSSGFLLCMLCLLPRCSDHRQCCHTPALSARKCPPTELTREDAMRTARARSPEMMLPLPELSPPRTCGCRLDCLFLMTGNMFYSMGRSHKRRRSDSSSEEGERQHRRRQQLQQHTHIHVHVHQPQQRHPDRSKRRSAHRERCRIQGETRRMESALRELDAQQATEVKAAWEEQQSAAQYSDRAPLIPFQADPPRHRPQTPSYEQVMARPPLPSYDEVVEMAADEEEAEQGPSRSRLANPYFLQQLRNISAAVQMQPERPTVITDVLYKIGSYIALALEPHLALQHRDDAVRDWATDVGRQLGFDDALEPDTVKQGTHAAPRTWRLQLRGRKPQGLTFGISSNAKYGVSQYAWASGAEWLISRIQAQTTAVRPPSQPPEDEDAQPLAYAPRQEFVDQVCADLPLPVPDREVLSASADTCRYSVPLLTRTCLLTSSGSTRNGSCSEATETADAVT